MRKILLALALALAPMAAQAQTQIEVRTGMTIGSYSNTRAGLEIEPRMSFDILARREIVNDISVYGALSRIEFGCREHFCHGGLKLVRGNHAILGAQYDWRFLWARAGGMIGTTWMQGVEDPGIGFGVQAAAGSRYELFGFQLLPGLSLERIQAKYLNEKDWAIAISLDLGVGYPLPF